MATAIEFENISKQYRLGLVSTKTLSHDINRWWQTSIRGKEDPYLKIGETNDRATKGDSEYVWALKDINFKVEQGDVVGIIGKNGAGKSTLLKLLSRVTAPTTGTIRARGRIASLLEVGTGFHPEMTGRENIYLNGAIMGMTKREIDAKLDEIVDFSGCERYLDTPVKRYSSGMTVRLGFAVAAHLDPEILVVDEVLAVGDAEFQKKAIGKMQDVSRGEGRTVLFVSHNMASIRSLCRTSVLLKNGTMDMIGEVDDVVDYYTRLNVISDLKDLTAAILKKAPYIEINSLVVNGTDDRNVTLKRDDKKLHIRLECETMIDTPIAFEARFYNRKNNEPIAFYSPSHYTGEVPFYRAGKVVIEETISFPTFMNQYDLSANLALTVPGTVYHLLLENVLSVSVEGMPMLTGQVIMSEAGPMFLCPLDV